MLVRPDETLDLPWLGVRKVARELHAELVQTRRRLDEFGALTLVELDERRRTLEQKVQEEEQHLRQTIAAAAAQRAELEARVAAVKAALVEAEDEAALQEVAVYRFRHPLDDAVAYQKHLAEVQQRVKAMTKADGGAVEADTNWTVNGSASKGRAMTREYSKLMLRAFNAEVESLIKSLRPERLEAAIERLNKTSATIERLGKTMGIRIASAYLALRVYELELTADFLQKKAEEREAERQERERLREERKVQKELERERQKLLKEKQHHQNALDALLARGDSDGADRIRDLLSDVDRALNDVDYREANIRAGYVYVISNVGSFGERMVKIGMTRRLDPHDRIRELSDASVPFNFDTHALFFSTDAFGIEAALHAHFADRRVNLVNRRREFFEVTPGEVKAKLAELAGELLQFHDAPDALEFRQTLTLRTPGTGAGHQAAGQSTRAAAVITASQGCGSQSAS